MASGTATITAKTGPAQQATAVVITDLIDFDFQIREGVLLLTNSSGKVRQFQLTGSNTITLTATSGVYALTIT